MDFFTYITESTYWQKEALISPMLSFLTIFCHMFVSLSQENNTCSPDGTGGDSSVLQDTCSSQAWYHATASHLHTSLITNSQG